MSVRMWMQGTAVPGGHIEHMAAKRHRRPAPPTYAPAGAQRMPGACVAGTSRCAAAPACLRRGI